MGEGRLACSHTAGGELDSGSFAETVMNVADQEGSCRTGVLALVYLFPETAVSNLVGGRVRPGALLDSVHVQLRKHGRGFYHSTVSP